MADQDPKPDRDPRQALAEVDDASSAMANSTDAPRGFMLALVALIATVMTLIGMVSWPVVLGVGALSIPLALWYFLVMRKRPKARPILNHSRSYVGYFLLLILTLQLIRFWEASSWVEAGAKWVLVFGVCWFCISRMRAFAIRDRLKDAHERHL
ncbi:hypothetical protein [Citricoccus sp. I39-566]|uniref:hypothetical protein n=1 Tax=Citricoccus sp. I39-566 TaxID=3073268 RepID=UPI00286A72F0|nr:hypothetical protein [Citricoccus sp. I39-566]WMY78761.1 hypothetical protein RE421_02510 [Citricoccus sp. I39-566]